MDASGECLARNGFLMKNEDPGAPLFISAAGTSDFIEDTLGTNRYLVGMQFIFDKYVNNVYNKTRPPWEEIDRFFHNISKCIPLEDRCDKQTTNNCDPNAIYRTLDGSCNNLNRPLLGTPLTPYARLLHSTYDNYVVDIRKSAHTNELPSPRVVINDIYTKPIYTHLKKTDLPNTAWAFFSQFVAHDLALPGNVQQRTGKTNGIRCCSSDFKRPLPPNLQHSACHPFDVPKLDKFYGPKGIRCLNFVRSQRIYPSKCILEPAEQLNNVNGFCDLSVVYGQTKEISDSLRTFKDGLLLTNDLNILPELNDCSATEACYVTADVRGNQTPQLALFQSLGVRLHNFVANALSKVNSQWNDQKLFQEARRICIAFFQHIVFEEFLPTLIDENLPLSCNASSYDPNYEGIITHDFSTGVYRSLHRYLPNILKQYSTDGKLVGKMTLTDSINRSGILQTKFMQVLIGLLRQPIKQDGFADQVFNKIFGGADVPSVDISRGRDHGIPPYCIYREFCKLSKVNTFKDLESIMLHEHVSMLSKIYKSARDIDLIVGGTLERHDGSILGPTFKCIARKQFQDLKLGDRFFYSHQNNPNPFTQEQLEVITKISFAKLLCYLTDLQHVQKNAFYIPTVENFSIECKNFKELNLMAWKQ